MVYADVDGHIGYQATGLIPIRATGDGSVPVPGDDDTHEWTGYVPYDKLPSVYDPPSGILATANGRVTPDGYPYPLSIEWMSPFRTQRLYKLLLNADKKFTPADMLAIQTDIVSPFDRFCAERFVYAVDHAPHASQRAKTAADLMRAWDGTMDTDSAAATIAVFSRDKLKELLLKAKLGDDWKDYKWFMSPVWLENVLTQSAAALAAAGLFQLRPTAGGRGGRSSQRRQRHSCAGHVEVGASASRRHPASLLEPLPYPEERRGHGQPAALRRPGDDKASGAALWTLGADDGRFLGSRQHDARYREWAVGQYFRWTLQRSVGRVLSRANVCAAVLGRGGAARGSAVICGWSREAVGRG